MNIISTHSPSYTVPLVLPYAPQRINDGVLLVSSYKTPVMCALMFLWFLDRKKGHSMCEDSVALAACSDIP